MHQFSRNKLAYYFFNESNHKFHSKVLSILLFVYIFLLSAAILIDNLQFKAELYELMFNPPRLTSKAYVYNATAPFYISKDTYVSMVIDISPIEPERKNVTIETMQNYYRNEKIIMSYNSTNQLPIVRPHETDLKQINGKVTLSFPPFANRIEYYIEIHLPSVSVESIYIYTSYASQISQIFNGSLFLFVFMISFPIVFYYLYLSFASISGRWDDVYLYVMTLPIIIGLHVDFLLVVPSFQDVYLLKQVFSGIGSLTGVSFRLIIIEMIKYLGCLDNFNNVLIVVIIAVGTVVGYIIKMSYGIIANAGFDSIFILWTFFTFRYSLPTINPELVFGFKTIVTMSYISWASLYIYYAIQSYNLIATKFVLKCIPDFLLVLYLSGLGLTESTTDKNAPEDQMQ